MYLSKTGKSIAANIDRITFCLLVDCLKSSDPQAVIEVIDQLEKEKRPLAIAPLYLVCKAHPNAYVCQRARMALKAFVSEQELSSLVEDQNLNDAIKALIEKYGHYRES